MYDNLISTAINSVNITDDSVIITYNSNKDKEYTFKCENIEQFEQNWCKELLGVDMKNEDASIGKFINQRVQLGHLTLDYILEQTQDMTELGWDAFQGSTMPQNAVVVGDE